MTAKDKRIRAALKHWSKMSISPSVVMSIRPKDPYWGYVNDNIEKDSMDRAKKGCTTSELHFPDGRNKKKKQYLHGQIR